MAESTLDYNLQKQISDLNSNLTIINSSYDIKTFSKAVSANTSTTIGSFTLTAGLWLVISHMSLANTGNSVFNHNLNNITVRSPEGNGGGSINSMIVNASSNTTVTVTSYTSIATTVNNRVYIVRLK